MVSSAPSLERRDVSASVPTDLKTIHSGVSDEFGAHIGYLPANL